MTQKISYNADGELRFEDDTETTKRKLAALVKGTFSNHDTRHQSGGGDDIKLDDLATPDDNTDLDASNAKHGLLPKLDTVITDLNADKVDGKHAVDLGIVTYSGTYNAAITLAAAQEYDVISIADIIVPSGAKVLIMFNGTISNDNATKHCNFEIYRDAVSLGKSGEITKGLAANSYIGIAENRIDAPSAGTYTYKIIVEPRSGTGQTIGFDYCTMNILVLKNAT